MKSAYGNSPQVSVVIPTYNRCRRLRKALAGVCSQDVDGLEIIVVDNNCSDDTADVVRNWPDPRVCYTLCTRQGIYEAINHGFRQARGQFLTWTSDDNWFHPGALGRMLEALPKQKADFVYCDCISLHEESGNTLPLAVKDPEQLDVSCCVGACFLLTRKVYRRLGDHRLRFRWSSDYDYWLRLRRAGFHMVPIHDEPLYTFVNHQDAVTSRLTGPAYAEGLAIRVEHGCYSRLWQRDPDAYRPEDLRLDLMRLTQHGWRYAAWSLLLETLRHRPRSARNWRLALSAGKDLAFSLVH
jgi:hypothetical protein